MQFMAFMYDDYYCWGVQTSFKGNYDSLEDATNTLRGNRYENQNLEVLDNESGAFHVFRWQPKYKLESKSYYVQTLKDGKSVPISAEKYADLCTQSFNSENIEDIEFGIKLKSWLVSRFDKTPEIIQDSDEEFEDYEKLGYWSTDTEDYDD